MEPKTKRSGLLLAALLLTPALAVASLQGDKKVPPKDDPEVPGLIKSLTPIIRDRKATRDAEGVQILDKLSGLYPKLNDKQQKAVAKAVTSVFKARREPDQVTLLLAAGESLSRFGADGADALVTVVDYRRWKNKREWQTFRAQIVRLIGRPAEKKYAKKLLDIALKDNSDQARAKAGEALGDYAKYDQKTRKPIVEKLVKHLEQVWGLSRANLDPNDPNRKRWGDLYGVIQDPWMRTLKKHTGQSLKEVLDWTKWWNKNKRKNWDKLGFRGVKSD